MQKVEAQNIQYVSKWIPSNMKVKYLFSIYMNCMHKRYSFVSVMHAEKTWILQWNMLYEYYLVCASV